MMLMLNEYKCINKYTQDPNDISGKYKHKKAMKGYVELSIEDEGNGVYELRVLDNGHMVFLGDGTLHKSPLLGDYIEFEIGVML